MQHILFGYGRMGTASSRNAMAAEGSFPAVSDSCRSPVGTIRLNGSATIEAVYIMAITFFAFGTLMGYAYQWKAETSGAARLHTLVEIARYQEEPPEQGQGETPEQGKPSGDKVGLPFGSGTVHEYAAGSGWELDITAEVSDPEAWLRMISLTDR